MKSSDIFNVFLTGDQAMSKLGVSGTSNIAITVWNMGSLWDNFAPQDQHFSNHAYCYARIKSLELVKNFTGAGKSVQCRVYTNKVQPNSVSSQSPYVGSLNEPFNNNLTGKGLFATFSLNADSAITSGNLAPESSDSWVKCGNFFNGDLQITLRNEDDALLAVDSANGGADQENWFMELEVKFDADCNCNNH